tara:strand:- start:8629 stop:12483 length:3855 start_codon:yes stop_codon:yes gene_type:complete
MASVFTNDLRLEEIGTGEQTGTWGNTTNKNLELIAEAFSYSSTGEAISNASTHTITVADGTSDEARSLYLKCTGGGQACTVTLAPNSLSKVWIIENQTSFTLTFSQGTGNNVAVLAGQVKMIATDGGGSDAVVYDLFQDLAIPDLFVDDDLKLQSDGAVLSFGADGDVSLTHVADTALLLNAGMAVQFRDSAISIRSSADATLDLVTDGDMNLTAGVDINIPANVGLTFGDDGEKIEGDGTDLTITGNNINLTATADVNIPSGVGLTFATAEKIESDGTDLSITVGSGGDINIPADIGLTFGNDGEKIEGDGTDLTITGNNINLTATADVVVPANVGVTFGTGEKIEGDNTDLTITSGAKINLTATSDVVIPSGVGLILDGSGDEKIESDGTDISISVGSGGDINIPASIGVTFGDDGEKIEGDGTDLTIASSAKINLTATSDIHVPNNVGIVFGGDSEKIEGDGTDLTISANNLTVDAEADIILDANGANVTFKDNGTSILDIANNSSDVELTVSVADKNFAIKGTDDSSAITALDIDMALAGKATFNGDVVVGGDLTVSGDDITMGTNTAGNLLIADGTNFNSVAVGSLSEISTAADDDVLIAVDTSGGGLKKITRSAIIAGTGSSGDLSNVSEDSTPQLGGSLDVNGQDIVSVSNGNITLTPNGTGVVRIDGSNGIDMQSGAISIKNSGAQSYIRFYCESSNAHYVELQAPAHADFSGNHTVTLPNLASTLATTTLTETLTNKTLTSPVLNTATVGTSIVPSSADGATLGTASAEFSDLFLADGGTIQFGNDQDVTLTHVADSALLLNAAMKLTFRDSALSINSSTDGQLDIAADTEVEITSALVEISADATVGDDLTLKSDAAVLGFGADTDVTLTHVADTGLLLNSTMQLQFNDASQFINAPSATVLDINATDEIELNATLVDVNANLDVSGTYTGGGLMTTGGNIVIPDAGTIGSASDTDAIAIGSDGDVTLTQDLELQHDAATLSFGADNDVVLTHVADTGLLLNAAMVVQFRDSAINIGSPADGDLDINADDEIELNSTLIDINGNVDVSGTYTGGGLMTTGGNIVIPNAGNIGSASDTDALAISSGGVVNFTQQPTVSSAAVKVAGKETIWIPAAAMYPESTNGCADLTQVELANGPELKCLDFDKSSDEFAQFTIAFPKSWNEGTITFKAYFTATSTDSGDVVWSLAGGSFSDNDDLNTAFGTAVAATAKAHSGTSNDLDVTAESGNVTIAGSPAAEDLCFFRILRDVSADDLDADARLLGIKLFFTTDAANDA